MKELIFGSYKLQYETVYDATEMGEEARTNFYMGTTTIVKKKWVFYGPEYAVAVPNKVFTVYADTKNTRLSKAWWREKIGEQIAIMNRSAEIERGELI